MSTATKYAGTRMSAEERREEILDAAMEEFALKGLHGTSTETIAQRVGISQPYLFRLFRTKKELFLATIERSFDYIHQLFGQAADAHPDDVLRSMGRAYNDLLTRRSALLLQLQTYAACGDSEVQAVVRRRFSALSDFVEERSGADEEAVRDFLARGMLLNVVAAMNLLGTTETKAWAQMCLDLPD